MRFEFQCELVGPVIRSQGPPADIFDASARVAGENAAEESSVGRSGV
jgi:hypothetical protein